MNIKNNSVNFLFVVILIIFSLLIINESSIVEGQTECVAFRLSDITPDGSKIYAANACGNNVWVIDTDTGDVINKIPTGINPRGVTITETQSGQVLVYVTNHMENTITVIDAQTDTEIPESPLIAGSMPWGNDVVNGQMAVANWGDGTVKFFDVETNQVIQINGEDSLKLSDKADGGPWGMAADNSGDNLMYVTDDGTDSIVAINTNSYDYMVMPLDSQSIGQNKEQLSYPSKFLCGSLPNFTFEDPLTPGNYATVVDVHNPNILPVEFEWKAVLDDDKISPFQNKTLASNAATKIDCKDIRDTLNNTSTDFLVGFVILRHDAPADKKLEEISTLDVVTAYTYYEENSGVSTDLEKIEPQKVARTGGDGDDDDCDPWDAMVKNDRKLMLACGNDPAFFSVLEIINFVTYPDTAIYGIDYTVTILESEQNSEINEPWGGNESPDGRYLLGVDMYNIAPVGVVQEGGTLYIWDSNSLELLGNITHETFPEYVGIAPRSVIMTDEWVFVFNSGTHRISDKPSQLEGIPFFYGDAQGSITKIPTEVIYEMFPLSESINEIRVLITNTESEIQLLSDGEPVVYKLDTVDKNEILDSIASRTNLNQDEIHNLWKVTEIDSKENGGGCLIATAVYGSELAPQVQFLREIRDNTIMSTASGSAFMNGFNQLYYSFSPTIADMERENPMFQEVVRAFITPMVSTLSIMTLVEDGSEVEVLGLGISVIALNLGMYVAAPAIVVWQVRKQI